jgi:ribA/ribD-fused uncharacterized protein
MDVLEFKGDYRFLSNMYKVLFRINEVLYLSVEHWYQANKTTDHIWYERIRNCNSPVEAKRMGNEDITLRPDWDDLLRIKIMEIGVKNKFDQNKELLDKLLATKDAYLEEGNTWNDRFFGVCNGEGENHLGKILMRYRNSKRR